MGVDGFDLEGELYVKSRFRDGVEGAGGPVEGALDEPATRTGEPGRASGGVTSVCRIEVNNELACSVAHESDDKGDQTSPSKYTPLSASDSVGISLCAFDGVPGPPSSRRW